MKNSTEANTARASLRRALPYLVVIVFSIAFYSPLFAPNRALLMGDYFEQNVPNRAYATERLRVGELPQWTDSLFGGFPFLCDPQTGTFYPPNLVLAAKFRDVGNSFIMDRYCVLHSIALALGGVFLARSFAVGAIGAVAAGVLISVNGYITLHYGHINIVQAIVASVWAFGMFVRAVRAGSMAWAIGSGFCLAGNVTAGHPQIALHAFYVIFVGTAVAAFHQSRIGGWGIARRTVALGITAVVIGFLLSLPQTLPTLSVTKISNRSKLSPEEVMVYSSPLRQLPGIIMPGLYKPLIFRTPIEQWFNNGYRDWGVFASWERTFYIGVVAFSLGIFGAVANRKRWFVKFLVISSVLLLVVSIGQRGLLYPLLYNFAPGFRQVRIPPRILWLFMLGWGVLAAIGIQSLVRGFNRRDAKIAAVGLGGLATGFAGLIAVAAVLKGSLSSGMHALFVLTPNEYTETDVQGFSKDIAVQLMLTLVLGSSVVLTLLFARIRGSIKSAAFVTLLLALELTIYGYHKNVARNYPGFSKLSIPPFEVLPKENNGRSVLIGTSPWTTKNVALNMEKVVYAGGYNPIEIKWMTPVQPSEKLPATRLDEKIYDFWNVRYLLREVKHIPGSLRGEMEQFRDFGWATISSIEDFRQSLSWDFETPLKIESLDIVATAEAAMKSVQGMVAANIVVTETDGTETTHPIVFGKHIADWAHGMEALTKKMKHTQPRPLYIKPVHPGFYEHGCFYGATVTLAATKTVSRVRVECVASEPVLIHVAGMRAHLGGSKIHLLDPAAVFGYKMRKQENGWELFERPDPCGSVWMVGTAEPASYKKNLRYLRNRAGGNFDPRKTVLINKAQVTDEAARHGTPVKDFAGTATLTKIRPENFVVESNSNNPGWVVISHTFTPGWVATMRGKPVEIIQANGPHMAIPVAAGEHRIEFRYTTPGVKLGMLASSVTLVVSGFVLFASLLRRRRSALG